MVEKFVDHCSIHDPGELSGILQPRGPQGGSWEIDLGTSLLYSIPPPLSSGSNLGGLTILKASWVRMYI